MTAHKQPSLAIVRREIAAILPILMLNRVLRIETAIAGIGRSMPLVIF